LVQVPLLISGRTTNTTSAIIACMAMSALCGCGSQGSSSQQSATSSSAPAFAAEPYTPQQQRVEQGAHLVIADGCSSCHLNGSNPHLAPSFTSLAGHRVTLTDGRHVLVDEHFLRDSLLRPSGAEVAGYDPAPMLAAVRRLHLANHPAQVAALVAFMEQIGPETE
jgi:cytochrome c oxidase subunit 2